MEVTVYMSVSEEDESGRVPTFEVDSFQPGHTISYKPNEQWAEDMDDVSPLPVASLLERAFKQNKMIIVKESGDVTQKLIKACLEKMTMDATISIYMSKTGGGRVWVGQYSFKFILSRMYANELDIDQMSDILYLDLVKGSLDMGLPKEKPFI